ncbi:MAG: signal peptide peptidase SppA [Gammaproteobacteria bacterium]
MFNKIIHSLDTIRRFFLNIFFFFFLVFFVLGLIIFPFIANDKPLIEGSILRIYSTNIKENKTNAVFNSTFGLTVSEMIDSINHASENNKVSTLFIDLSYLSISNVSAVELGESFKTFKESGKKVIAYGDFLDQNQYLLASFANEIVLNPQGLVYLEGFKKYNFYLKDALEKFNIQINTYVAGEFKSAIEIFTRSSMSEEDKLQSISYLNDLWQNWLLIVNTNRASNLSIDINDFINNFSELNDSKTFSPAEISMKYGLIDKVLNKVQLREYLLSIEGIEMDYKSNSAKFTDIDDYYSLIDSDESFPSSIAVINATGEIFNGSYQENQISSINISQLIRDIKKDSSIKGLLLRINSPGGSGFASETIRQELLKLKSTGIPIIASMSDVAASGGYWIAADANEIWASPLSLTGSIGVFAILPSIESALNKYGVNYDGISTNNFNPSLISSPNDNLNNFMQTYVDNAYNEFIEVVSNGRNLSQYQVREIAKGRVWTGNEAKKIGLVNELGTQSEAIEKLAELAELENYNIKYLSTEESFFEILKSNIFNSFLNVFNRLNLFNTNIPNIIKSSNILDKKIINLQMNCMDCLIQ